MKKFTVKDFMTYNGPCFSCGAKVSIKIGVVNLDPMVFDIMLTPTITSDVTEVDLKISYNSSLKLKIFNKTNSFQASSMKGLTKYLEGHKLFLKTNCSYCYTNMESQYLEFNLLKGFIKPVGLISELLVVNDGKSLYQVQSSFIEEKSHILVTRLDKATPLSPLKLDIPIIPRYRFKDKEHFINKIKTFIVFS